MSLLQKVCCFFLFGKMLLYLCPDEKYEAYYGLLLEWSMFALIFVPLLAGGSGGEKFDKARQIWEDIVQEAAQHGEEVMEQELEEKIQSAVSGYADRQEETLRQGNMTQQGDIEAQKNIAQQETISGQETAQEQERGVDGIP